jgi:hypothetical protein
MIFILFPLHLARTELFLCDKSLFVERVNKITMHNKTIIEFGFCDIPNYRGLGKCYISLPFVSTDN